MIPRTSSRADSTRRTASPNTRFSVAAATVFAVTCLACGGDRGSVPGGGSLDEAGSQLFEMESQSGDATLTDEGRILSPEVTDAAYVDRDGGVIRYRDVDEIADLEEGMVVSLGNQGLRRVDAFERSGDEIVLSTSPATLDQLIEDGTIEWSGRVTWRQMPEQAGLLPRISLGRSPMAVTQATSTEVKYQGTLQGYKVTFELKAAGTRLDVKISGEKATAIGGKASFTAEGWISDFTVGGGVTYESRNLEEYETSVDELEGELEVKFAAIDLGQSEAKFVVPAKITVPFRIYGIPADIGIGASITVKPQFHAHGSSQASFKAEYATGTGLRFANGGWTFQGGLVRKSLSITDETVSASPLVIGMGLQIDFPLMELRLGGGAAVLSLVNKTNIHSFYDPALNHAGPPEQSGGIDLKGLVQAKLGFFGVEVTETRELWNEELNLELDN